MISAAVVCSMALVSSARAWEVVNQLETSRIPQAAQRVEFGVNDGDNPFVFTFKDSVMVRFYPRFKPIVLQRFMSRNCQSN
jgi:hypothetical protein